MLRISGLHKTRPASDRLNKLHVQKLVRIAVDVSSWICEHCRGVESLSDSRVDANLAVRMLVGIGEAQSLDEIFKLLVSDGGERPNIVCVQAWLIEKGDLCATCPCRTVCPDQSRCLHLVAAKGRSISGKKPPGFESRDARIPLDVGPVGKTVMAGQEKVFLDTENHPGMDWLRDEEIRGYRVVPIWFKGEPLGATVAYTRQERPEEIGPWGRIFANQLGSAIAHARAFDEVKNLKAQLELQNAYLQEAVVEAKAFGDLVGQSAALRHIVSQVDMVAPTDASVLVLGETGTGKELVAHEIHRRSQRKDGPLVRVNCASIPRELFESEFFGHMRGSFTGAVKDRAGRFETAEGGTIFLDEVGEIPLDVQNKLLRVLQEKRYERVGDDRTRRANVRIIAATNRDLKQTVAAGKFREDLYYRLNVFPINVPSLRERLDDIPSLTKHFVDLSTRDLKCAKPRLTRAGIAKLQNYDWPGNIRELRNVIERAVILARGGALDFDLPVANQSKTSTPVRIESPSGDTTAPKFLTEGEMQRRERDNLLMVLEEANWKIKGPDGAAELMGVKPTTLLARMKKWGLKKPAVETS
jgi:transcriptional regulator with GAF, ATPase, and Fis domain